MTIVSSFDYSQMNGHSSTILFVDFLFLISNIVKSSREDRIRSSIRALISIFVFETFLSKPFKTF